MSQYKITDTKELSRFLLKEAKETTEARKRKSSKENAVGKVETKDIVRYL